MPLSRREADTFFKKKISGADRTEGRRHIGYRVLSSKGTVLLPNLTISRGPSGDDLDLRNVKGLAEDMGLSLEGFVEASRCNMRQQFVMYCVACRVIVNATTMHRLDKIAFGSDMATALSVALLEWLAPISEQTVKNSTSREKKEVSRASKTVRDDANRELFVKILTRLSLLERMMLMEPQRQ